MEKLTLPRIDGATTADRVQQITSYIYKLVEQLQMELGQTQETKIQIGQYTIEAGADGHLTVY